MKMVLAGEGIVVVMIVVVDHNRCAVFHDFKQLCHICHGDIDAAARTVGLVGYTAVFLRLAPVICIMEAVLSAGCK